MSSPLRNINDSLVTVSPVFLDTLQVWRIIELEGGTLSSSCCAGHGACTGKSLSIDSAAQQCDGRLRRGAAASRNAAAQLCEGAARPLTGPDWQCIHYSVLAPVWRSCLHSSATAECATECDIRPCSASYAVICPPDDLPTVKCCISHIY